ncbi:MAG: hypothetical protein CMD92_03635 [Gammaproteobacteria bacterium]|nr:hypothetical protein [Gammaproteobacteria bacterium]
MRPHSPNWAAAGPILCGGVTIIADHVLRAARARARLEEPLCVLECVRCRAILPTGAKVAVHRPNALLAQESYSCGNVDAPCDQPIVLVHGGLLALVCTAIGGPFGTVIAPRGPTSLVGLIQVASLLLPCAPLLVPGKDLGVRI